MNDVGLDSIKGSMPCAPCQSYLKQVGHDWYLFHPEWRFWEIFQQGKQKWSFS